MSISKLTDAPHRMAIQRDPLDYWATKANYTDSTFYYYDVVEPWLETASDEHPEASGTIDDVRTDVQAGHFNIAEWRDVETIVLMVNARIGEGSPQFHGEVEKVVDQTIGWRTERGRLTTLQGSTRTDAESDLATLVKECSGNIYSTNVHTVVGGTAAKGRGVKKVKGLNDPTSRIDIQNPPSGGGFNLQFQVGDVSVASVLFGTEDDKRVVLDKLVESFASGVKVLSPRLPG